MREKRDWHKREKDMPSSVRALDLVNIPDYLSFKGLPLAERRLIPSLDMHNRHLLKVGEGELPPGASAYLEPGVHFKTDILTQQDPVTGESVSGNIHVVGMEKVPMGDWDWKDPYSHNTDGGATIESLGDVHERLSRYTQDNPDSSWRVYLTPGGVRAWEMSRNQTPVKMFAPTKYGELQDDTLRIDPFYQKLTSRKKYSPAHLNKTVPAAFYSRVSGKPLRENDFVAFPLGHIGDAPINPYNERLVGTYHDDIIQRWMQLSGTEGTTAALDLLNKHLDSVPRSWGSEIEQSLEQRGLI